MRTYTKQNRDEAYTKQNRDEAYTNMTALLNIVAESCCGFEVTNNWAVRLLQIRSTKSKSAPSA